MNDARPIGIPATGRVDDSPWDGGRDHLFPARQINARALAAACDNKCLDPCGHIADMETGTGLQQMPLVFIDGHPRSLLDELSQFLSIEHRQPLPRVE